MAPINWMAFALAVIAQMFIGFIWYHPAVMGKTYAKSLGISYENMKPNNPGLAYGLMIVFTLFFTFFMHTNVTGHGHEDVKYHTFQHGFAHAGFLGLLVLIPILGTLANFENRGWGWFLTHLGHWVLRIGVAGGILSYMQ